MESKNEFEIVTKENDHLHVYSLWRAGPPGNTGGLEREDHKRTKTQVHLFFFLPKVNSHWYIWWVLGRNGVLKEPNKTLLWRVGCKSPSVWQFADEGVNNHVLYVRIRAGASNSIRPVCLSAVHRQTQKYL